MKNMIRLSFIGLLCVSIFACSGKKSTTATPAAGSTASAPPAVKPAPVVADPIVTPPAAVSVRFVVSFYSKGEGIDYKIKDEFVNFLSSYPKKIAYQPTTWGREGEVDFCLMLTELTAAEQNEFIKKANDILNRSALVHKKENSACEHNNWPPPVNPAAVEDSYRLVVSFYSKGEGSDYKTKEEFEKFLNSYPKKTAFEPTIWGREGEVDYCLKLSELSSLEQVDFVKKAKELLVKSALVHVDENAKCVHKH